MHWHWTRCLSVGSLQRSRGRRHGLDQGEDPEDVPLRIDHPQAGEIRKGGDVASEVACVPAKMPGRQPMQDPVEHWRSARPVLQQQDPAVSAADARHLLQ